MTNATTARIDRTPAYNDLEIASLVHRAMDDVHDAGRFGDRKVGSVPTVRAPRWSRMLRGSSCRCDTMRRGTPRAGAMYRSHAPDIDATRVSLLSSVVRAASMARASQWRWRGSMQADKPDSDQNAHPLAKCLTRLMGDVDAMRTLHRIAERYAGLSRGSFGARELVAEVIEDMLFREARCDQLREFPADVVQRAVKLHVLRRAQLFRKTGDTRRRGLGVPRVKLVPLDQAPAIALAVDALPGCPDRGGQDALEATELVSRIREYAHDDAAALRLLELYDRGVVTRRKVLRDGMTVWSYRTARERLVHYATMALCADTAPGSPPAAEYAAAAVRPLLAALGVPGRAARTRRAVDRAVDAMHRLSSA